MPRHQFTGIVGVCLLAAGAGCDRRPPAAPPSDRPPVIRVADPAPPPPARHYEPPAVAAPPSTAVRPPARAAGPPPLPVAGTWVPSGWMGDAGPGVLTYKVGSDRAGAAWDEWTYDPARGSAGWAAVSYQTPDKNWGDHRGKDLSGKGYTRLVLQIRSPDGARLVVKSGGHTAPGARYPASYEASAGVVVAGPDWATVTIPLAPPLVDLSNCPTALVLAFSEALGGGTVQVRGAEFRGPGD